jgi:anti-repressor protein
MELIKIEKKNGIETVNARELHEFLESKRQFADWIKKRIEIYGFYENKDYYSFSQVCDKPQGGRPSIEYYLTIDMAKEISMLENNDKGKLARQYFIECEKKLKMPLSLEEMTLLVVEGQKQKIRELENQVGRLIHSTKTYTATEIAKELNLKSATELNKILESKGIQYKQNGTWLLTAKYSECGYTSIKQEELDSGRIIYNRHWTGKGRDFVVELLSEGK